MIVSALVKRRALMSVRCVFLSPLQSVATHGVHLGARRPDWATDRRARAGALRAASVDRGSGRSEERLAVAIMDGIL